MKRKKAKKYFDTSVWFTTNLSDYKFNLSKFNSKKGSVLKKYGIDADVLDYIIEDFQVFDRIQFGEMIDMNLDEKYTETLILMLKENIFEQFCDIAHLSTDLPYYESELNVFYNSLSDEKQDEFKSIWNIENTMIVEKLKSSNYNELFEIVGCKDTTLFLLMMDAYIENNIIFIGSHSMLTENKKNKYFKISPSNEFDIEKILLPNGKRFTYDRWKELQNGK